MRQRTAWFARFVAASPVALASVAAVGCSSDDQIPESLVTQTIEVDLETFITGIRAGDVEGIVVDDSEISFAWKDMNDSITYKTRIEPGATFEEVLLAAGFEPEEFPDFDVR
jgi:hypothetical protein